MNQKINSTELAELLADFASINKTTSVNIIKEFNQILIEGLIRDKIVKISGLGTFKITQVAARKSVNVNTGEEIEIPTHSKVSFTPETALKEKINSSNANNSGIDPMKKLEKDALEVNEILKEFNRIKMRNEEKKLAAEAKTAETAETKTQEVKIEPEFTPRPTIKILDENADTPAPKPVSTPTPTPIPTPKPTVILQQEPTTEEKYEEPRKRNGLKWFLWSTLIFLIISGLSFYYFLYADYINFILEGFFEPETEIENKISGNENTLEISDEQVENKNLQEEIDVFSQPLDFSQTLANETLTDGTWLATFATKYYGHHDFWIYIYLANKSKIENPNRVEKGIRVRIPKMDSQLVDKNSQKAIDFAINLAKKYKSK